MERGRKSLYFVGGRLSRRGHWSGGLHSFSLFPAGLMPRRSGNDAKCRAAPPILNVVIQSMAMGVHHTRGPLTLRYIVPNHISNHSWVLRYTIRTVVPATRLIPAACRHDLLALGLHVSDDSSVGSNPHRETRLLVEHRHSK